MQHSSIRIVVAAVATAVAGVASKAEEFNFARQLFGPPSTLSVWVQSLNATTGTVEINGVDTQGPLTPFSWEWGDGTQTQGFFPQQHVYGDRARNYAVHVTAHYSGGGTDSTETVVRFVSPIINPIPLPSELQVAIPSSAVALGSRMPGYSPPATITFFADADFGIVPRSTLEYVLSAAAYIQKDFVNGNVADVGGGFEQVLLRDSAWSGGGMYSLWFTDPVAFGAAAAAVQGSIAYSSFMHEMGHNFTLNTPANFYYGGKIDGNANAIFSESMAQMFQHATAYQIINNAEEYGLGPDLVAEIKASATSSMNLVRNSYDDYVQRGANFHSWNDPSTPQDETFGTFMTIAYIFFEHAETRSQGYRIPLRRMMQLLQILDQDMVNRYDRLHDAPEAETFRSTLMVAAVSHAFSLDLRSEFAALNFPIDNTTCDNLLIAARLPGDFDLDGDVDLYDFHAMQNCYGSSAPQAPPPLECDVFNTDRDDDIDLIDVAAFVNAMTGIGAVCGNGTVETGEQCDDGNTISGDGCSSTCQSETGGPRCGNGLVETGEQCDDGNMISGDGCSATCQLEGCGLRRKTRWRLQ